MVICHYRTYPPYIYLFQVYITNTSTSITNTRATRKICSNLTIKAPERRERRQSVFIVKSESFTHCYGVSIVDFEQVNAGWVVLWSF